MLSPKRKKYPSNIKREDVVVKMLVENAKFPEGSYLKTKVMEPRADGTCASLARSGYLVMAICGCVHGTESHKIKILFSSGFRHKFKSREHQRHTGLFGLQPKRLPEWKWDNITMDFVTKLPKSSQGYDQFGDR
ncbi:hypothetical protein Tco_0445468 [Tanacetum coccineum]